MPVIAVAPGGRAQAPARDDRFGPVIALVHQHGLTDRPLLSPVCKTQAEADDIRRGLYRSARYFCSCQNKNCTRKWGNIPNQNKANPKGGCPNGGQRLGCRADVVQDTEGKLRVQFRLFDKAAAMRQVIKTYGPDPNEWPYFARRKQLKEKISA